MKKVLLSFAVLFAFLFTGCNDDDGQSSEDVLRNACIHTHECNEEMSVDQCLSNLHWKDAYDVCESVVVEYFECHMSKGCGSWNNYAQKLAECRSDAKCDEESVRKTNPCNEQLTAVEKCAKDNGLDLDVDLDTRTNSSN